MTCKAPGCNKPRRGKFCSMHWRRMERHGCLEPPRKIRLYAADAVCEDCGRPRSFRGLARGKCPRCYVRWYEANMASTERVNRPRRNRQRHVYGEPAGPFDRFRPTTQEAARLMREILRERRAA